MSNPEPTVADLQAEVDRLNRELAAANSTDNAQPDANPPANNLTAQGSAESNAIKEAQQPPVVAGDPLASALAEPAPEGESSKPGATVIGAAPDPRGGFVVAYSDGTVTLDNVPEQDGEPAQPWGNAPEGPTYTHFFTDRNGDRYNFVTSDNTVKSVENPIQHNPPA